MGERERFEGEILGEKSFEREWESLILIHRVEIGSPFFAFAWNF